MKSRLPLVLGTLSALVILVCVAILSVDYSAELKRAPGEDEVVATLREQVRTDAAVAETLHAERERQTAQVLARKARSVRVAWVLVVAGGLFLGCGKKIFRNKVRFYFPSFDIFSLIFS